MTNDREAVVIVRAQANAHGPGLTRGSTAETLKALSQLVLDLLDRTPPPSEPSKAVVEKVARAICRSAGRAPDWTGAFETGAAETAALLAAIEAKDAVTARMVELYHLDSVRVAAICDEQLDRSGNLLGYLRTAALTAPAQAKGEG